MAATQLYATLPSGSKMPLMAFGTLMENLNPDFDQTVSIVEKALSVGYRHLDAARIYNTETMVGRAVQNAVSRGHLTREQVFITTKLWRNAMTRDRVVPALRESLADLGMDYVDLFLVHWPTAFIVTEEKFPKDENGKMKYANTDYLETWKGMEECVDLGLAKAIGVSNFNSKQLQRVLDNCRIKPANNQIESHPFLTNSKVIDFCHARGVSVTAYAPLGGFNASYREKMNWPTIFSDERIKAIAARNNMTPGQVALRYQLQRGVAVAPKSARRERMEENFQALSCTLTDEDMKVLDGCDAGFRLNAEFPDHPHYPFHDEF